MIRGIRRKKSVRGEPWNGGRSRGAALSAGSPSASTTVPSDIVCLPSAEGSQQLPFAVRTKTIGRISSATFSYSTKSSIARAFRAARCSASFLVLPCALARREPFTHTSMSKVF